MDIDAVVRMSLAAHAEAAAATEQQVGEIVQRLQSAIANTLPECILEDFCVCRGGRVFDGVECVDGTPWAARATQLVAPAGLPHVDPANPASPEVYVSLPETLLSMPGNRKAESAGAGGRLPYTPAHTHWRRDTQPVRSAERCVRAEVQVWTNHTTHARKSARGKKRPYDVS